jgi:hypothetical protein
MPSIKSVTTDVIDPVIAGDPLLSNIAAAAQDSTTRSAFL